MNKTSTSWELENIHISHAVITYDKFEKVKSKNDSEFVRLHFGLQGSYEFEFKQLKSKFKLSGHHNNIMYTKGLELEVFNKSHLIETFGVNYTTDAFIALGQNGNDPLKRFTEKVMQKENSILSKHWKTNDFKIQNVIQEIINCAYQNELKQLFLLSKSIELLVLQADLYTKPSKSNYIKLEKDKKKFLDAKELLHARIDNPPTIVELSKLTGINEYKLKKGFKELFGITIFGYIHNLRMELAKRLLLDTKQSAKEIAYVVGYSSPQHFSNAFKKKFGVAPNSARNNPDTVTATSDPSLNLDTKT